MIIAPREANIPSSETCKTLYKKEILQALTIRRAEERLLNLFSEGKLFGTVHTCIGQEFVGISVARNLTQTDFIVSNHRCHGHFISCRNNVEGLIAEVMGKSNGVCRGLGGSQHLYESGFFSNGVQGGIVPVAAGLSMAKPSTSNAGIAVVFIGDGTLGEGVVYESMNIAAKWELPLLIVLENNFFAQSTSIEQTLAGEIGARFKAFGIETRKSDTWDWTRLLDEMESSVKSVRTKRQPIFHQVDTFRLMAHSKGDDNRPAEFVAPYQKLDPINLLIEHYGQEDWFKDMETEVAQRIDLAVEKAESAPFHHLDISASPSPSTTWKPADFKKERIVEGIRRAFEDILQTDSRVLFLGEDIESPYGGAFKATLGLSDKFPNRVRNTPISEAAIVGIGNGLALGGKIPVVEIMFGDFVALAADQWINHASKFSQMYAGKVSVPLILRTPMGGKRGYGPTHSQSLEKILLGFPGTQVLSLHHRQNPKDVYDTLFKSIDKPTLVIENKLLYGAYADPTPPPGYTLLMSGDQFPVTRLKPNGKPDVTIVAVGGIALDAEKAIHKLFEEEEALADLFIPVCLFPFDTSFLSESLAQTGKLVLVEEGPGFGSFTAELAAQVAEDSRFKHVAIKRVTAAPLTIPAARPLELQCLPGADKIFNSAMELL